MGMSECGWPVELQYVIIFLVAHMQSESLFFKKLNWFAADVTELPNADMMSVVFNTGKRHYSEPILSRGQFAIRKEHSIFFLALFFPHTLNTFKFICKFFLTRDNVHEHEKL